MITPIRIRTTRLIRKDIAMSSLGEILDEIDEIDEQIEDLMDLRELLETKKDEIRRFGFTEPDPQTIRNLWTTEAQS